MESDILIQYFEVFQSSFMQLVLRVATWKQGKDKNSDNKFGHYLDNIIWENNKNTSYGDDPRDQEMIKQGIEWYDENY